ncbi:MAG TPA: hypothetical protein VF161_10745 [Steroidobacteraceae bacterium]
MTRWHIAGLILLAIAIASPVLWTALSPNPPPAASAPAVVRETFDPSKALDLTVRSKAQGENDAPSAQWLERELRHVLNRAKMRIVAADAHEANPFTLRVDLSEDSRNARLVLLSPDGFIEREETLELDDETRLGTISALAARLPRFLGRAEDWTPLIGTNVPSAYDVYLDDTLELFGPRAYGLTRPSPSRQLTHTIERLERLVRTQPRFARAWAALAGSYLGLGGQDARSLIELAESSAQRALTLDEELAQAHAILGLVHSRRGEWIAAREQLDRALSLDASEAAALEGLGCLLVDAGQYTAARPVLGRAIALQPQNNGARECLAYIEVSTASATATTTDEVVSPAAARVRAVGAILNGDPASAHALLSASLDRRSFRNWAAPMLEGAASRRRIPDALRAITLAANEDQIDPWTEILCGLALEQDEFVFNRMLRLQRRGEAIPFRILWLSQAASLRKHPRFEDLVSASTLPTFWQEYGPPDICASDPSVFGCQLSSRKKPHPGSRATSRLGS